MSGRIYVAPDGVGKAVLGETLPGLLYSACERYPNASALVQRTERGWSPVSSDAFRSQVEEVAAGLMASGLNRGDRAALFLPSDVEFCIADFGCLLAGIVDVPIYLTHGDEAVGHILRHSEARAVFVSAGEDLARVARLAPATTELIVVCGDQFPSGEGDDERHSLISLADLRERGRAHLASGNASVPEVRAAIRPDDTATIIYTSGTTGKPKGVVLTHENISYNALTAFSGLKDYRPGPGGEIILSFLPLTHVFARTLLYGYVAHGSTVYFSDPDHISEDLRVARPTIFASVPRLLEKVYTRIRERAALEKGLRKKLLKWALDLAHAYDLTRPPSGSYRLKLAVADRLIFSKWRQALGGRVKYIISGGAALNPELAAVFAAAGVTVLQGYGLTESSPIISYNRPERNRPDTVGTLLPGLEVKISDDGEILTRGPHVMKGYFRDPERTEEAIDEEGWLHTGDVGEMTSDGFLRLTDRKKDLFKLSTGKYVMPQPLESRLTTEPLVEQVIVIGEDYRFCTALIFPDQDVVRTFAKSQGLDHAVPIEELLKHPKIVARFERIVDRANRGLDPWSTIKRFVLIPEHLSIESGLLTPTMKVRRPQVRERYADQIKALYAEAPNHSSHDGHQQRTDHAEAVLL